MRSTNKPRILILGCGSCQLEALRKARDMGFHVLAASNDPCCPGKQKAHEFLEISTFDEAGILQAAKRHAARGILVVGTDQPLVTAAKVSACLGLHSFLTPEQARNLTNKKEMKAVLSKHGIPANPYTLLRANFQKSETAEIKPPFVLKPVDSQGQRGVLLAASYEDAARKAADVLDHSREEEFILEEFYAGPEITVSGWVHSGVLSILTVSDRISFTGTPYIGICRAHLFPSKLIPSHYEEIYSLCRRSVEAFGLKEGPVYVQILAGEDGLRINEITARIGGAYEDIFIPLISGFDILEANIKGVMGMQYSPPEERQKLSFPVKTFIASQLFFLQPGTIHSISEETELKDIPGLIRIFHKLRAGDTSEEVVSSGQRAGFIIVHASSAAELDERIDEIYRRFKISGDNGVQMISPLAKMSGYTIPGKS